MARIGLGFTFGLIGELAGMVIGPITGCFLGIGFGAQLGCTLGFLLGIPAGMGVGAGGGAHLAAKLLGDEGDLRAAVIGGLLGAGAAVLALIAMFQPWAPVPVPSPLALALIALPAVGALVGHESSFDGGGDEGAVELVPLAFASPDGRGAVLGLSGRFR